MAFYQSDDEMERKLEDLIVKLSRDGRPNLARSIAITWIRYPNSHPSSGSGLGASWGEEKLLYPASIVKIIYAVAIEAWIQKDLLPDTGELRRAMQDMIFDSSNNATGLLVDLLTGTTSGPSLYGERWDCWKTQRLLVNEWLESFNWPELKSVNCCQKTWDYGPYGREKDFYGEGNINRNALRTSSVARILEGIMTESLISPQACKRLKKLLGRSLNIAKRKEDSNNQIDGFLGEGLEEGTSIFSKAGLMSQVRHDAAWISTPKSNPMLLVVFSQGRQLAQDIFLLPRLAKELWEETNQISRNH